MTDERLVSHAREMREQLSSELPNGVGNTIDSLCDRIQSLTADNAVLREALERIAEAYPAATHKEGELYT